MEVMNYYQMTDVGVSGRWYLKGLFDANDVRLDTRDFRQGHLIPAGDFLALHAFHGQLVEARAPFRVGVLTPGASLDFTYDTCDVPIVTLPTANLIRSIDPSAIQVIPVSVERRPDPFFIINVIQSVRCIDERESQFARWTHKDGPSVPIGDFKSVSRLIVDKEAAQGRHFFRVDEWKVALIASEVFKQAFENEGLLGVAFEEV